MTRQRSRYSLCPSAQAPWQIKPTERDFTGKRPGARRWGSAQGRTGFPESVRRPRRGGRCPPGRERQEAGGRAFRFPLPPHPRSPACMISNFPAGKCFRPHLCSHFFFLNVSVVLSITKRRLASCLLWTEARGAGSAQRSAEPPLASQQCAPRPGAPALGRRGGCRGGWGGKGIDTCAPGPPVRLPPPTVTPAELQWPHTSLSLSPV